MLFSRYFFPLLGQLKHYNWISDIYAGIQSIGHHQFLNDDLTEILTGSHYPSIFILNSLIILFREKYSQQKSILGYHKSLTYYN